MPFPWLHIVGERGDISPVSDQSELGPMRPLHLRRGDFDQAGENFVGSSLGVPAGRHELGCISSVQSGERRKKQGRKECRSMFHLAFSIDVEESLAVTITGTFTRQTPDPGESSRLVRRCRAHRR